MLVYIIAKNKQYIINSSLEVLKKAKTFLKIQTMDSPKMNVVKMNVKPQFCHAPPKLSLERQETGDSGVSGRSCM